MPPLEGPTSPAATSSPSAEPQLNGPATPSIKSVGSSPYSGPLHSEEESPISPSQLGAPSVMFRNMGNFVAKKDFDGGISIFAAHETMASFDPKARVVSSAELQDSLPPQLQRISPIVELTPHRSHCQDLGLPVKVCIPFLPGVADEHLHGGSFYVSEDGKTWEEEPEGEVHGGRAHLMRRHFCFLTYCRQGPGDHRQRVGRLTGVLSGWSSVWKDLGRSKRVQEVQEAGQALGRHNHVHEGQGDGCPVAA